MSNHPNRSKKWQVAVDTTNTDGATLLQWGKLHTTRREACRVLKSLAFTGTVLPYPSERVMENGKPQK